MSKFLLIIAVLGFVIAYLCVRYRRQIALGIKVFRALRDARSGSSVRPLKPEAAEQLLRCSRCGAWVGEGVAVKLRGQGIFCSSACIEAAARNA